MFLPKTFCKNYSFCNIIKTVKAVEPLAAWVNPTLYEVYLFQVLRGEGENHTSRRTTDFKLEINLQEYPVIQTEP